MTIESLNNSLIKHICSLKQKKERDKSKLFVVEGERFVNDIPSDWEIKSYIVSESFKYKSDALKLNSKLYTVTDRVFKSISDTEQPQGILAVCKQREYNFENVLMHKNPFLVIADCIQNPGNLGTVIRTADAAGVTGILLSNGTVDLYNPKTLRATMGSIFHIPIIQNVDLESAISKLKQNNISIISTDLKSRCRPYDLNLKLPISIVIGNEANGISDTVKAISDFSVKLPIVGMAESLNVSVATGIILYEVVRQRLGAT